MNLIYFAYIHHIQPYKKSMAWYTLCGIQLIIIEGDHTFLHSRPKQKRLCKHCQKAWKRFKKVSLFY